MVFVIINLHKSSAGNSVLLKILARRYFYMLMTQNCTVSQKRIPNIFNCNSSKNDVICIISC